MDPEAIDFLSPTFDPEDVTIPRLRSILLEQNVHYPANAKKAQLVDLFNENVAPRAKRLRRAREKTQPTTNGIEDHDVNTADDVALSVEATPRRTNRRSAARRNDASTTTSRRSSAALSSRASTEDRARASVSASDRESVDRPVKSGRRKTRHSIETPMIKEEDESSAERLPTIEDASPFSSDNPFQSGSSPLPPLDSAPAKDRRRTTGLIANERASKSRQAPRKSDPVTETQSRRRVPRKSPTPLTEPTDEEVSDIASDDSGSVETGEEFTQEEQDELREERALTGKRDLLPARRKPRDSRGGPVRTAPWAILVAALGGLGVVWRQEKLHVGYCGVGRPSTAIGGVEIPDWADFLRPQCEPCPPHAYCQAQLETICEPDFVLQPHPLSLGGVVPVPPSCEPDGEKARKVKAFANRAVGELRSRNAQYECGLKDTAGKKLKSPEIREEELKSKVSSMRRREMSQSEFDDLWSGVVDELLSKDEITSGNDGLVISFDTPSSKAPTHPLDDHNISNVEMATDQIARRGYRLLKGRNLRSNSLAGIPFACAIRRSVRLTLARYIWQIVGVMALVLAAAYTRHSIVSGRSNEEKAKRLASFALDRLATRASQHTQDPTRFPEAYISMGQLRDDVLRNEFSAKVRQKLWVKVQKKVENNSNVRSMVREGRTGEVSRVWEWIGAITALEDSTADPASNSPAKLESSPLGRLEGSAYDSGRERREARRWEEGRPIY